MNDLSFKVAPHILLGNQTSSRLGALASPLASRYLLVLDPATKETKAKEKLTQVLSESKIDFIVYEDMPNDPTTETLAQVLKLSQGAHIQGVIACGGEKALNLGRGVASLFNEDKPLYDFVDGDISHKEPLPLICIPTSIRDTFLFYERCAIIDARSNQFRLLKVQEGLTKEIIFDVSLGATLTKNQISSISLNLLCLAFETYFSNRSSFFSDAIAEKIFELMAPADNLTDPLASPETVDESLLQCGCMAALAASLSAPGPITALAFATYSRYKVSRSLLSAILLPYLIEEAVFSSDKILKAAKLLGACGNNATPEEAADLLAENIRGRIARAGLPARLKELSVSIEQIAASVNDAMQLDFIPFYAKPVTADSLFNLVKQAY
ncbi:MAG: iron-containing alcohol dehydrogenase [Treponemataceae bacterium]|nr:iron-containing alcohol dehydrogenase [Treponemataceae bacterium]